MANSRSNIYPIQLQGAELNLNKLDAEIKQYSGFNKNNSPFVGGCLANVFTKEEQAEGANDNNTIITEDGTVYRVDTTGLYKNDEKLIDTEGKDFYDVEELSYPESTVYVYDDDTYIYFKNGLLYYHSGKIDEQFFLPYGGIDIDYSLYQYVRFNVIRRVISGDTYDIVGVYYFKTNMPAGNPHVGDSASLLYINFYKKTSDGELDSVFTKRMGSEYFVGIYHGDGVIKYDLLFKTDGNTYSDFKLLVITGVTYHVGADNIKNNFLFTFDGTNITLGSKVKFYFATSATEMTNSYIFRQLYFTDDYVYSIPTDIRIDTAFDPGSPTRARYGYLYSKMTYTIDFSVPSITVNNTDNTGYGNNSRSRQYDIIFNKWGAAYSVALFDNSSPAKTCVFIQDDKQSSYVSPKLKFEIGGIINNCVLINNNVITGLTLPGGWILACEWNSVDEKFIFFGDNNESWRTNNYVYIWKNINNGHWYKLKKSQPWVKKINNQIIINSNTLFNAYDYSRDKILLFAPGWNNRHLDAFEPTFHSNLDINNARIYFATCINEYALEDNASLLLNPVPMIKTPLVSYLEDTEVLYHMDNDILTENSVKISYYSNASNDTIIRNSRDLYISNTGKKMVVKEGDFSNWMIFPTNTDGNIQYSPSLFVKQLDTYGNTILIKEGETAYKLMTYDNKSVMSFFLSTAIEGLQDFFVIQGQLYGILDDNIFSFQINNEVVSQGYFVVSVKNLQFVGNTPYEALFFSKTNRCLYSFTGANVLNQKQLVDKISEVRNYLYNPATQTIFLVTNIGVFFYSIFGQFLLEYTDVTKIFIQHNGIILSFNNGNYRFIKYYLDEGDTDFEKQRIKLETCFYGMNNEVVTINDCLYVRLFSEEHEEGNLEISATTLSLSGRMTEKTTFNIKASDWDAITHTIYLRYQPKEQRGLGISFSIDSPFKIASLSVGSKADAILVDKISKKAINAPSVTSNNDEW